MSAPEEKAYSGDIILVQYSDGTLCHYTVDMRLSDMGSVDEEDDCVIIDEELSFSDDEYGIVEYVNDYHFHKQLDSYLSKSDEKLLADFKCGSEGAKKFNHFMRLVRRLI